MIQNEPEASYIYRIMGRYFLELAYNGTHYHGWQIQQNAISVQEVLETCIETILGQKLTVTAAGRTDTGVHALQQVAHIDMPDELTAGFLYKLNAVLPLDIAAKSLKKVKENAHARYSAISRRYEYKLHNNKDPFKNGFSCFYPYPLDIEKMNKACNFLLGEKDFKSFSKTHTDVPNFKCSISEAGWLKNNDQYLFSISANRFLRGMVRAIVGSLLEVSRGNLIAEDIEKILAFQDRRKAGKSMPASGLYLAAIEYPDNIFED